MQYLYKHFIKLLKDINYSNQQRTTPVTYDEESNTCEVETTHTSEGTATFGMKKYTESIPKVSEKIIQLTNQSLKGFSDFRFETLNKTDKASGACIFDLAYGVHISAHFNYLVQLETNLALSVEYEKFWKEYEKAEVLI